MPLYVTVYNKISPTPVPTGSTVQEVADELCEGLKTDYEKANALFEFVHQEIEYDFYYDTQYGAQGTLDRRAGNCCNQAQLLVAMCRDEGLTVQFVHGTCYFYSNHQWFGHVWTEINIDGEYLTADPTGYYNALGVIPNWDVPSADIHNSFPGVLPFLSSVK